MNLFNPDTFLDAKAEDHERLLAETIATRCEIEPCGSRVTCNPAPTNTDADFLVFVKSGNEGDVSAVVAALAAAGFRWEGSEHYQVEAACGFMSWRKDERNYIVSSSPLWVKRHRAATALCKRLNLMNKADRIAVFKAVLYGELPGASNG